MPRGRDRGILYNSSKMDPDAKTQQGDFLSTFELCCDSGEGSAMFSMSRGVLNVRDYDSIITIILKRSICLVRFV